MAAQKGKRVALVGATGVVGTTIGRVLAERRFPIAELVPIATTGSGGRQIELIDRRWQVQTAADADFDTIDLCFFTAGAAVSRDLIPTALDAGCRVVDNTTAFRMDADVPLVVPEINGDEVTARTQLVACPNCTTINLVMSLAPILRSVPIERVVVTSMQSVSGAGKEAVAELDSQSIADLDGSPLRPIVFPRPIAFNCVPQVGDITPNGNTVEEEKIIEESRKILSIPDLSVSATAVRVPVRVGHSLSVNVELAGDLSPDDARSLWREAPGVDYDDGLPTPRETADQDTIIIGRVRRDETRRFALNYWVVGDNLRKGAATNSVQIAELWNGR